MIEHEMVMSSCYGTIQEVSIENHSRIYEWEPLFTIETGKGNLETLSIGISGEVYSLEVQKGDKVIPGMVLALIKEDLIASGSD
jgi:biotin carboxyl carrier protein